MKNRKIATIDEDKSMVVDTVIQNKPYVIREELRIPRKSGGGISKMVIAFFEKIYSMVKRVMEILVATIALIILFEC